jgi:hypothetical protein
MTDMKRSFSYYAQLFLVHFSPFIAHGTLRADRRVVYLLGCSLGRAVIFLLLGSSFAYGFPWNTDMQKQPSIRSQEFPLPPPPNSIPRKGREPSMNRIEAGTKLRNPIEPASASIESGKRLYQLYCALCHGANAKGGGPIAKKFVPPPDLTLEVFRKRTDGFIYATIRDGGPLMPGQKEALSPRESWDIVNYLRSLQGK